MKVARKTVVEEWDLPDYGSEEAGVKIIEDTITGTSRWAVRHRLIVKVGERHYMATYQVGATERQEEQPWQDQEEVNFTEVQAVPKLVTVWEAKA